MSWVLDVSVAGCLLVLDVSGCWMSRVLDVRVLDVQMLDVPLLDVCESVIMIKPNVVETFLLKSSFSLKTVC